MREQTFEPVLDDSSSLPIRVSGAIEQIHTKANAAGFVDKDAIGLYAVNYSDNNTLPGTLMASGNQADNVKYIFDEANQKWNPVRAVYYKDVNTNVDLYLTYPYQTSISDVNAYGFEVQKDQSTAATNYALSGYEASDLLLGKAENITPSETVIPVSLKHTLSAIQVTLKEKDGFEVDEFEALSKSILVTNTTRKATVNLATGEVTAVGGAQVDGIVMCPQDNGSFRAIVIPQTVDANTRLFSITLGGVVYGFSQPNAVQYQPGKQMNVEINVSKKTPTGEYELELESTQIVNWTEDRNTHGGEARQYYVATLETPGTLGRVIKNAGKNPNKIRNLKVCGPVTDSDFYFMRDSMEILEAVNMKESVLNTVRTEPRTTFRDQIVRRINDTPVEKVIPQDAFSQKKSLYYFSFPEETYEIGDNAFNGTGLSGALIIPDNVRIIGGSAFYKTNISSLTLPAGLKEISAYAFYNCTSLSGQLELNESLECIDDSAFDLCSLRGHIRLPAGLKYIGCNAFKGNRFIGDLEIPELIKYIPEGAFSAGFTGHLDLNNVTEMGRNAFANCGFAGELVVPEGVKEIPDNCFVSNSFSAIVLPSTLKFIGVYAFASSLSLTTPISIPEGVITIGLAAFQNCYYAPAIELPSSIQTIGQWAFQYCNYISRFTCHAIDPPLVLNNAFNGIPKDNFTVEVPSESVRLYQAETGWSDFKRIGAHYDFSVSRNIIRTLNASSSHTLTLRAPANESWEIQSKPEWVTVTPSTGIGKTDITVSIDAMERTEDTFNEQDDVYYVYKDYKGREGEVIFELLGKNYTYSLDIQQFDYDYADGESIPIQTATKGAGIDIVYIGDGFDAKDIASGLFLENAIEGNGYFFNIEPYSTYKDYFNVYAVVSMSKDSGIGTVNTIKESKFGSYMANRILMPDNAACFSWAANAKEELDISNSLVIVLLNTPVYEGVTAMYGNGAALAVCPVSRFSYPYDFRGIIQHEAGGHGFAKLGDEYIYHGAFIQNCGCPCCQHLGEWNKLKRSAPDWFRNLSVSSDIEQLPWAHLIYNPNYSDYVDIYEGGWMHSRGVYRSETISCMNNNIPYYSAISRQVMVERIMEIAGEEFTLEKFYENDSDRFGNFTKSDVQTPNPGQFNPHHESCVMYMGETPELK